MIGSFLSAVSSVPRRVRPLPGRASQSRAARIGLAMAVLVVVALAVRPALTTAASGWLDGLGAAQGMAEPGAHPSFATMPDHQEATVTRQTTIVRESARPSPLATSEAALATRQPAAVAHRVSPTALPHPSVRIAFIHQGNVRILDSSTGHQTDLATAGYHDLSLHWSSDGQTLFIASGISGQPTRVFRWRSGQALATVAAGLWSPDGSAVASVQAAPGVRPPSAVQITAGGHTARITPAGSGFHWFPLAWSPNGQHLALGQEGLAPPDPQTGAIPPTHGSLWITRGNPLDGNLTQLPLPSTYTGGPGWPDTAAWSPDSRYLAVGVGPNEPCASCRADGVPYYAIPIGGGKPIILGSALDPVETLAWAPKSAFVVLSSWIGSHVVGRETYGKKHLIRIDLPAGTRRDLSRDSSVADVEPAVSPDGALIAFARGRAQQPWKNLTTPGPGNTPVELIASRHLWLMNADGTDPRQLTNAPGWTDEAPVWSSDGHWIFFVRWQAKPTPAAALWAIRPDGTGLTELADGLDTSGLLDGFGYYGSFGWRRLFAISPR